MELAKSIFICANIMLSLNTGTRASEKMLALILLNLSNGGVKHLSFAALKTGLHGMNMNLQKLSISFLENCSVVRSSPQASTPASNLLLYRLSMTCIFFQGTSACSAVESTKDQKVIFAPLQSSMGLQENNQCHHDLYGQQGNLSSNTWSTSYLLFPDLEPGKLFLSCFLSPLPELIHSIFNSLYDCRLESRCKTIEKKTPPMEQRAPGGRYRKLYFVIPFLIPYFLYIRS